MILTPPQTGTLIIETVPPGAEIFLDNIKQQGVTPLTLQLTPKQYLVKLIRADYKEYTGAANVEVGKRTTFSQDLERVTTTPTIPADVRAIITELGLELVPGEANKYLKPRDTTGYYRIKDNTIGRYYKSNDGLSRTYIIYEDKVTYISNNGYYYQQREPGSTEFPAIRINLETFLGSHPYRKGNVYHTDYEVGDVFETDSDSQYYYVLLLYHNQDHDFKFARFNKGTRLLGKDDPTDWNQWHGRRPAWLSASTKITLSQILQGATSGAPPSPVVDETPRIITDANQLAMIGIPSHFDVRAVFDYAGYPMDSIHDVISEWYNRNYGDEYSGTAEQNSTILDDLKNGRKILVYHPDQLEKRIWGENTRDMYLLEDASGVNDLGIRWVQQREGTRSTWIQREMDTLPLSFTSHTLVAINEELGYTAAYEVQTSSDETFTLYITFYSGGGIDTDFRRESHSQNRGIASYQNRIYSSRQRILHAQLRMAAADKNLFTKPEKPYIYNAALVALQGLTGKYDEHAEKVTQVLTDLSIELPKEEMNDIIGGTATNWVGSMDDLRALIIREGDKP